MDSWTDIEKRFRALEEALRGLRLGFQWGDAGEHWDLTGVARDEAYRECLLLSGVAGKMLEHSLTPEKDPGRWLLQEQDLTYRWFQAVKELSGRFESRPPAYGVDEDGNRVEAIYTGWVSNYIANSANLCLWLEAEYPIQDRRGFWERLYQDHGRTLINGTILIIVSAIVSLAISQCPGSGPK